jgi:hypothetical protein
MLDGFGLVALREAEGGGCCGRFGGVCRGKEMKLSRWQGIMDKVKGSEHHQRQEYDAIGSQS